MKAIVTRRRTLAKLRDRVNAYNLSIFVRIAPKLMIDIGIDGKEVILREQHSEVHTPALSLIEAHSWMDGWTSGVNATYYSVIAPPSDPARDSASSVIQEAYDAAREPAEENR